MTGRATATTMTAVVLAAAACAPAAEAWVGPMKKAHATFKGEGGTVAQLGDTAAAKAFFVPLAEEVEGLPAELAEARRWLSEYVPGRCWHVWRGLAWGNGPEATAAWVAEGVDGWLKRMDPEVALVAVGATDARQGTDAKQFAGHLGAVVKACVGNGTIPVLYTVPPGAKPVEAYSAAVRQVATEAKVPLIDAQKVLAGAKAGEGHAALNRHTLRTLRAIHEQVLSKVPSARDTLFDMEWGGIVHKGLPALRIRHDPRNPVIDGWQGEPVWKNQRTLFLRRMDGSKTEPEHEGMVKIYTSPKGLYIAYRFADDNPDGIVARKRAPDDDGIFKDDHGELFLRVPGRDKPEEYYHLVINPNGSHWTAFGGEPSAWNPRVRVGAKTYGGSTGKKSRETAGWHAEIEVPWSAIKLPEKKDLLAGPWRINVCRGRPARGKGFREDTAVSPTERGTSRVPSKFAYAWLAHFGGSPPQDSK